jgi:hypothetical protein
MKVFILTSEGNRNFHPRAELTRDSCIYNRQYEPQFFSLFDLETGRQFIEVNSIRSRNEYTQLSNEADYYIFTHIALWNLCVSLNESIIVAEHNALFVRNWDEPKFESILNLSESVSDRHSDASRGDVLQVHQKPLQEVSPVGKDDTVEAMSGVGSVITRLAYAIKPHAALTLIQSVITDGYWYTDKHIVSPQLVVDNLYKPIVQEQIVF